jgi:hypothetical protein
MGNWNSFDIKIHDSFIFKLPNMIIIIYGQLKTICTINEQLKMILIFYTLMYD